MKPVMLPIALCVGIAAGGLSVALLSPHSGHAGHFPLDIPKDWSDTQLAAFVAQSDKNIDAMAGRTLAPGEVYIDAEGLRYWKSVPGLERAKCEKWCPKRKACHDT